MASEYFSCVFQLNFPERKIDNPVFLLYFISAHNLDIFIGIILDSLNSILVDSKYRENHLGINISGKTSLQTVDTRHS